MRGGIVQHIENLVGTGQQGATGFGQANFAAQAIEQAHVSCCSRPAMRLLTAGWVRCRRSPARKSCRFGDGNKGIEVGEIHVGFSVVI